MDFKDFSLPTEKVDVAFLGYITGEVFPLDKINNLLDELEKIGVFSTWRGQKITKKYIMSIIYEASKFDKLFVKGLPILVKKERNILPSMALHVDLPRDFDNITPCIFPLLPSFTCLFSFSTFTDRFTKSINDILHKQYKEKAIKTEKGILTYPPWVVKGNDIEEKYVTSKQEFEVFLRKFHGSFLTYFKSESEKSNLPCIDIIVLTGLEPDQSEEFVNNEKNFEFFECLGIEPVIKWKTTSTLGGTAVEVYYFPESAFQDSETFNNQKVVIFSKKWKKENESALRAKSFEYLMPLITSFFMNSYLRVIIDEMSEVEERLQELNIEFAKKGRKTLSNLAKQFNSLNTNFILKLSKFEKFRVELGGFIKNERKFFPEKDTFVFNLQYVPYSFERNPEIKRKLKLKQRVELGRDLIEEKTGLLTKRFKYLSEAINREVNFVLQKRLLWLTVLLVILTVVLLLFTDYKSSLINAIFHKLSTIIH